MTKLVLVRHGQTLWNIDRKYQGHSDIALSSNGKKQAYCLRERFRHERLAAIYTSDLSRALETGQIVGEFHTCKINSLSELREINFGKWEGLTHEEIQAQYGELEKQWRFQTENFQIPGGESFQDLKKRVCRQVLTLVKKHRGETFMIVAHGGTIRTIICSVLDLKLNKIWCFRQDNTAVNIIEFFECPSAGLQAIISVLNDTCHLF